MLVLRNLFLTVLIEGILMLIFTKSGKKALHSVPVNMLTNPLLNLILIAFAGFFAPGAALYFCVAAVLEISVLFAEAFLYRKMGDFDRRESFFASLLLNGASFCFGLFL